MQPERWSGVRTSMKRHSLGILVFASVFVFATWFAPIRFFSRGIGHGSLGGDSFCAFGDYGSTHLYEVSSGSCSIDPSKQEDYLQQIKDRSAKISQDSHRLLIEYSAPESAVCSYRFAKNHVWFTCSRSIRAIEEFEGQFVKPRLRSDE